MIDEPTRFFVTHDDLKDRRFEAAAIGDAVRACDLVAQAGAG